MGYAKKDGSYVLEYTKGGVEKFETVGGYYSNGISLLDFMRIKIQKDTALIDFGTYP
ncbi:hypothetical protein [Maribacter sp. 4G9]|uniref:hypothetical protein n=1 Tax=Maribacter sp. 4G9 TaxID=1889777 RepID=UPI0013FDDFCC|nr:hypothetical protein [Maribacter sp. 4G9]